MTSLDKLTEIPYVTESHVDSFEEAGFEQLEDLVDLTEQDLQYIDGVGPSKLKQIYQLLDREGIERAEKDENYQKFRGLLEELFQFESADLDFGIYRIMNERRDRIEGFLDEELEEKAQEELKEFKNVEQGDAKQDLEDAREEIQENFPQWTDENGNVDEDEIPEDAQGIAQEHKEKYLNAKKELQKAEIGEETEAAIYQDLYRFFKRYYKDGDFIPQRRAANQEKYAIPYNGEEVKLHWANKDQYFVKTGEHFKDYKFDKDSYEIEFKLHDAHVEKNNKKGDEKFFVLRDENPVEQDERFLTVHFEYRPLTEEDYEKYDLSESSQASTYKKEIRKQTEEKILSEVSNELEGALNREVDNPRSESTVLQKHLKNYRTKNENDYFIHKDLGGFLEQELDFYLKNEVFSWKEMTDDNGEIPAHVRARLNAIENIAQEIIDFVAEIEDYQKKLFEKKKFIVNTEYCITLDKIPEELYPEILENEEQIEEWKELYALEEQEDQGLEQFTGSDEIDEEFLKQNQSMMVDTKHFDEDFKNKVISSFNRLDAEIDGEIIKSENYQANDLIKLRHSVDSIYLDPPYNTELDREKGKFIYKDNFPHSSWISFMYDRLSQTQDILSEEGSLIVSCDDNEVHNLRHILDSIYGEKNFIQSIAWKSRNSVSNDELISLNHNYNLVYTKNKDENNFGGLPISKDDYSNPDDDPRGPWKLVPIDANKPGGDTEYGIENPNTGEVHCPPNDRSWAINKETFENLKEDDRIKFGKSGEAAPKRKLFWKERMENGDVKTPISIWSETETTKDGTEQVMDLFGEKRFDYPKPNELIEKLIEISYKGEKKILDFFAGSGTTAHAVINIQREKDIDNEYVLVEMGDYYETIIIPRIKKAVYSKSWKDGVPQDNEGVSQVVKYSELEQFEDTLDNLDAGDDQTGVEEFTSNTLEYFLNFEVDGKSLLDLDGLKNPFSYEMRIREGDEAKKETVDLVETFNYLLGLEVRSIERFEKFDREYRIVEGVIDEDEVAVVWRPVSDEDDKEFYSDEREFVNSQVGDPDRLYVNHDSALEGAKSIEKKFETEMWD